MESDETADGSGLRLIERADIRGDLQMHSTWSDGQASVEAMARAGAAAGYEYVAITDHSRALAVAHGLTPQRVRMQRAEIERVRRELPGLRILRGVEVDILPNGRLDLPDDLLAELDIVVVAVHTRLDMPRTAMTERVIRGISHAAVHILAHPTGRIINRRNACDIEVDAVLRAAAGLGIALEINAQPHRLDLDPENARLASGLGIPIAINTDAHALGHLGFMDHGIRQARLAGLRKDDVLNARRLPDLERWLAREPRLPDTA